MNEDLRISRLRYWCGTQSERILSEEEFQEVTRMVAEIKAAGGAG